jgi:hypothetical protein
VIETEAALQFLCRLRAESAPQLLHLIPPGRESAGVHWKFTVRFGKNRRNAAPGELPERIRQNPSILPQILPVQPFFA